MTQMIVGGSDFGALLSFGLGLAILLGGGYSLIPACVSLATKAKLSPRLIAGVIIAGGTSAPELLVSLDAGIIGNTDIAIANILGSNITNIFLVFGLGMLIVPVSLVSAQDRREILWLLLVTLLISAILMADGLTGWTGQIIGLSFIGGFILFTIKSATPHRGISETVPDATFGLLPAIIMTALSITALVVGAHFMVASAVSIATSFDIEEAVIGATIVAIGTSLPEIIAVSASLLKKRPDMAISNIIGSNLFNICIVLGITAFVVPLPASAALLMTTLPFFVLSSLLLYVISRKMKQAGTGFGAVFIGFYGCFALICYSL